MEQNAVRNEIFTNGATWLRADFHLHTIKDNEFNKIIENPNDFFNQYIQRLKEEEINIGLITNHNKFDKEEFANLYKKALKEEVWLVPGVELSVNDGANGIHCLIAYDKKSWINDGEDYINQFLTAAFEGIANRENENTRCNYDLNTVLKKLNDHRNAGRDSFIILAHVDQNSGFFDALNGGRIQGFAENDLFRSFVLGFQKVRTFEKLDTYKHWFGGKLPAFVEGSDCKSIAEVGKAHTQNGEEKKTYIKIGDFNFEALKFALTAHEDRVSVIPKNISNSYIKSITFEGGKLDGIRLDLSAELNSFIGIRGSGKSTILEILRYALGIPLSNVAVDSKYKNDLISYMLGSGGKTIITLFAKNGREYRVEKIYDQKANIFENDILQPNIAVSAIFETPVYFGQKDLSNKDADFESDLMQRLIGTKLKDIENKIAEQQKQIEYQLVEINKHRNLKEQKDETQKTIDTCDYKLKIYKEKGVEDKLQQQTQFDSDITTANRLNETIKSYLDELFSLIENYEFYFGQEIKSSEFNRDAFIEMQELKNKLNAEFQKLKEVHSASFLLLNQLFDKLTGLLSRKEDLKEEFGRIKRELNNDTINPDDFLALNRQLEMAKLRLNEINKAEKKRTELKDELLRKLTVLEDLWLDKYRIIENEVKKINDSANKLTIEIGYKSRRDKFQDKLKQIFRGTNIRESSYERIISEYNDFIEIYKDDLKLRNILNDTQFSEFMKRFVENMTDLLTYKVSNKIVISYNGKPLENHSLGQRASALILFLLAQKETDVLIIDQPEDDLDNQTIYDEVIRELKKLKGNMQFIFATHNANIPVLGDSEKVIACSFDEKQIHIQSGNVDCYDSQRSIVHIMEGGEVAFNRRKTIYGIWNI
ncbi:MAG: hypothetical protein KA172_04240 [Paludibacter sp.]|nr:hypothetical protein [Paludibacter sp.]